MTIPAKQESFIIWHCSDNGNLGEIGVSAGVDVPDSLKWCTQALETYPLDTPQEKLDDRLRVIRALSLDELVATYY